MDEVIRQLTHDNQLFHEQWPTNSTQLFKSALNIPDEEKSSATLKVLNALFDYLQVDNEEFHSTKTTFIQVTIDKLGGKDAIDLEVLANVFCRALDVLNPYRTLTLIYVEKIYNHFRLGERLVAVPLVNMIEKILDSLQRQEFRHEKFETKLEEKWKSFLGRNLFSAMDSDNNKLNHSTVMLASRTRFQQLYR